MRLSELILAIGICAAIGCNQVQLRRTSLQQARTALDLQYQQVLDNLALMQSNPAAIPSFALVDQGTVLVDTTATMALAATWNGTGPVSTILSGGAQRHFSGNWILKPLNGGDRIGAMQCVYRITTGQQSRRDPSNVVCAAFLKEHYKIDIEDVCQIPDPGWYTCGSEHDVPKTACFVGHHGSAYVWVIAGGEDSLARLTLTILDIAWKDRPQKAATSGQKEGGTKEEDIQRALSWIDIPAKREAAKGQLRNIINSLKRQRDAALKATEQAAEPPFNPLQSMVPAYGS